MLTDNTDGLQDEHNTPILDDLAGLCRQGGKTHEFIRWACLHERHGGAKQILQGVKTTISVVKHERELVVRDLEGGDEWEGAQHSVDSRKLALCGQNACAMAANNLTKTKGIRGSLIVLEMRAKMQVRVYDRPRRQDTLL
jgi:hypothetical protein